MGWVATLPACGPGPLRAPSGAAWPQRQDQRRALPAVPRRAPGWGQRAPSPLPSPFGTTPRRPSNSLVPVVGCPGFRLPRGSAAGDAAGHHRGPQHQRDAAERPADDPEAGVPDAERGRDHFCSGGTPTPQPATATRKNYDWESRPEEVLFFVAEGALC